jgi:hypothetical protein
MIRAYRSPTTNEFRARGRVLTKDFTQKHEEYEDLLTDLFDLQHPSSFVDEELG